MSQFVLRIFTGNAVYTLAAWLFSYLVFYFILFRDRFLCCIFIASLPFEQSSGVDVAYLCFTCFDSEPPIFICKADVLS